MAATFVSYLVVGSTLGHRRQRSNVSADVGKLKKGTVLRAFRKRAVGAGKMEFMLESAKGELYRLSAESLNELEHGAVPPKVLARFAKLDELRGVPVVNMEQDPMGLSLPTAVLGVYVRVFLPRVFLSYRCVAAVTYPRVSRAAPTGAATCQHFCDKSWITSTSMSRKVLSVRVHRLHR